jgi:hypothetical protein
VSGGLPALSSLSSRLGRFAPIQFAGPAVILVALIVFTPVLLSTGPSALAAQAELTIYRVAGGATTEFYVHSVGGDVAYARIVLDYGYGFPWTGDCPVNGVTWNPMNVSDRLELGNTTSESPFMVNATAVYSSSGATEVYAGMWAFDIANFGLADESVRIVPCTTTTPGLTAPGSWAVPNLPLNLWLVNYGSGGPP